MTFPLLVVVVAIGWAAATGHFSIGNLLFGAVIAAIALFLVGARRPGPGGMSRTVRILSLALLFIVELFVSAFRVAVLVLRPNMKRHLKPGFVAFPLTLTHDAEIALLANMITLTPGTLSVDVSEDRKVLYIHVISVTDRDALVRDIAEGFERKIIGAFR